MKFTSTREYFIKLHNCLYAIALVPLLLFAFLHLEQTAGRLMPQYNSVFITYAMVAGYFGIFVTVILWSERELKEVRSNADLRVKLRRYFFVEMIKFGVISIGCLLLCLGLFLTGNAMYSVLYIISLIAISFFWPTPTVVCKDLLLKGEERDLVLKRKEFTE